MQGNIVVIVARKQANVVAMKPLRFLCKFLGEYHQEFMFVQRVARDAAIHTADVHVVRKKNHAAIDAAIHTADVRVKD